MNYILLLGLMFISLGVSASENIKILFGSCAHQDKSLGILENAAKENADVFVFLGDNIYGDTQNMQSLKNKYSKLGANPNFIKLKQNTPLVAIWDDHDYGENDAGKEYSKKEESKQIMLDFWDEPKDSQRRLQKDGLYGSYLIRKHNLTIRIILPDLRWNRDELKEVTSAQYVKRKFNNMGPYLKHTDNSSMIGQNQWLWLEKELSKPADLRIIASSIQLLSDHTGWEAWGNFPYDKNRLFRFIKENKINGVLAISGDTHWAEISEYQVDLDYPIYDITSSGLSEEWKQVSPNKYRVSKHYSNINFGELKITIQEQKIIIGATIKDKTGKPVISDEFSLTEISPY